MTHSETSHESEFSLSSELANDHTGIPIDAHVFMISVAAELAGMHAQTLRTYDRLGLVSPKRTQGGGRRYSSRDVQRLREVQRLSQEDGINLSGIKKIIELTNQVDALKLKIAELAKENQKLLRANMQARSHSSSAVVLWKPRKSTVKE